MIRANQKALYQATNQGLLGIRQQEINYYLNLNLAFGTQAALIGGFTYGVFTQNQLNDTTSYGDIVNDICWIMSAATIATAVHVILNTMVLQVYGPGLALHGPIGSIARATEGLKVEQKQIVTSFMMMMIFFAISTTLSFWVVMNFESALGSTAVFVVAARYWYYYTERIYLRFYWDSEKDAWEAADEENEGDAAYEPPEAEENVRLKSTDTLTRRTSERPSDNGSVSSLPVKQAPAAANKKKSGGGAFSFFRIKKRTPSFDRTNKAGGSILDKSGFTQSSRKLLAMEGYLTKGGLTRPGPEGRREPWERRYFTLTRQGLLYFYRSRQDFRAAPKAPLNNRPLNLSEYYVYLSNTDGFSRQASVTGSVDDNNDDPPLMHRTSHNFYSTASHSELSFSNNNTRTPLLGGVNANSGSKHVFELVLVLRDEAEAARSKQWVLRCDTEEELDIWVACMRDIAPDSFRE